MIDLTQLATLGPVGTVYEIATEKQTLQIRVTPKGFIRVGRVRKRAKQPPTRPDEAPR